MRTEEITIYRFEELSEDAKENALNECRTFNVDFPDWWGFTYEHFKESVIGPYFEVENIYFSGFWSQGDGAMFEYSDLTEKMVDEAIDHVLSVRFKQPKYKIEAVKKSIYWSGHGKHSGHYHHEKSVSHSISLEANDPDHENIDAYIELYHEELEDYIIEKYEELAQNLYRALEKVYVYQTSDETVKETIEANGYEFTENGKMY